MQTFEFGTVDRMQQVNSFGFLELQLLLQVTALSQTGSGSSRRMLQNGDGTSVLKVG